MCYAVAVIDQEFPENVLGCDPKVPKKNDLKVAYFVPYG